MKKLLTLTLILFFGITSAFAQRFAYIDTDYILNSLDQYKDAQTELDAIAEAWEKEIGKKYEEVENMYRAYEAEQVLLTEEQKQKRRDEITEKEKLAKSLQKKRFGYEGDLFVKRQELIKPIQDKIYDTVKKLANKKTLDFVFDKSNGVSMLFANPKYDISGEVLSAVRASL